MEKTEIIQANSAIVIIAFTGSVAAVRAEKILALFTKSFKVIAIFSKSAEEFVNKENLIKIYKENGKVYFSWEAMEEIDYGKCAKWINDAAALLVAPVSANSLSKFMLGISDTILVRILGSCILLR